MIKPCYYKGERGNKPYDLELMLRLYLIQNLYNLADEASIIVGTQSTNDFLDPEVKFYGQSVLDLPTFKLLFSMDGKSLKETTELFDLNDAQSEYISSGQRGTALMKVGNQAVIVRFELSEERLEMFGRGGGR